MRFDCLLPSRLARTRREYRDPLCASGMLLMTAISWLDQCLDVDNRLEITN